MFLGEESAGYDEATYRAPISTEISSGRVGNNEYKRTRRIAAMLTAWPRRSPRLLLPAPPSSASMSSRKCDCTNRMVRPTDLPEEVLLSIFEYLTNARDIAAVRGVCQTWRLLVDRTATLWRSLVFDLPRCPSSAFHAESWYRKAADYGNAQAQVMLPVFGLQFPMGDFRIVNVFWCPYTPRQTNSRHLNNEGGWSAKMLL